MAAATPDGYTLLAASMGSHVSAPVLTPGIRYDSTKDFEPIGLTANAPVAVVARKDFPAKDLKEFIAYVKEHGDSVKQAHGGIGASSHMACLLFTSQLGLKPKLIPYRGTGPALSDLIGDHVDFFCEQVVSVAPAVKGKSIKAYVVSGDARSPACRMCLRRRRPAFPNTNSAFGAPCWRRRGRRRKSSPSSAGALDKALDDPAVAKRLVDLGGSVPTKAERGPAHFAEVLKADIARWQPVLKAAMPDIEITAPLNPWPGSPRLRRGGLRAPTGCRRG